MNPKSRTLIWEVIYTSWLTKRYLTLLLNIDEIKLRYAFVLLSSIRFYFSIDSYKMGGPGGVVVSLVYMNGWLDRPLE